MVVVIARLECLSNAEVKSVASSEWLGWFRSDKDGQGQDGSGDPEGAEVCSWNLAEKMAILCRIRHAQQGVLTF